MTRRLLKVEEVAPQIGMTKAALYAAIRENQFPHLRIGKRLRVPEDLLDEWIKAQSVLTPALTVSLVNGQYLVDTGKAHHTCNDFEAFVSLLNETLNTRIEVIP